MLEQALGVISYSEEAERMQSEQMQCVQLLFIDDNESDVFLLKEMLSTAYRQTSYKLTVTSSVEAALSQCKYDHFDIVVMDYSLPGLSGLEGLHRIKSVMPTIPVIVLTTLSDEALALEMLKNGAQDFLTKEEVTDRSLRRAINYALQRREYMDKMFHLANYDVLTGLSNRYAFEKRMPMALARAKRTHHTVAIMYLDLDKFKAVNDTYGHSAGDWVLKEVAQRLSISMRQYDTIARLGGDEFAILLEDLTGAEYAELVAKKIIVQLNKPYEYTAELTLHISASIGIAICPAGAYIEPESLVNAADDAMYQAKKEDCGYVIASDIVPE